MDPPALPRRSPRKAAAPSSLTSTTPPLSPFSDMKRPDLPHTLQNAFSFIKNSSISSEPKMNSENAGDLKQKLGFTKEQFEALCDKQRNDLSGSGMAFDGLGGGLRSPSQIVEMSWNPRKEQDMKLADEVNEWIEFLPYGDGARKAGSKSEGKENSALALCKWILTTRKQVQSGHWTYVDRQATREEILRFQEKGWPWYR